MSCYVCSRQPNQRLQFCCSTCARNQLYPLRLDHAQVLLDRESSGGQIDGAVTRSTGDDNAGPTRWLVQATHTRRSQSTARTQAIRDHIAELKEEIQKGRKEISERQAIISQRRSDAESATYRLSDRRAASVNEVQDDIKKTEQKWNSLHNKTAEARVFLCREVADLYRLRQKTRRRNGALLNTYALGGMSIVDLRDMNNASPTHITTSISYVAHLLVLISHYLSLRLPAEITLPHRGYPLPTAFPPSSSYMSGEHRFPGVTPSHSSSTSPVASRTTETKPLRRPRPLFLHTTLPKLAKDDPATYTLFLEGVSLLAWDVSWVCKTQGVSTGAESWEDVCDMGKNLWHLIVAPTALHRVLSGRDQQTRAREAREAPNNNNNNNNAVLHRAASFPKLGHYSHGTAHSFLGSAEGTEFLKTWKVPSPLKIADKLKSTLLSEMTNAEWELVEENEWDDGGEQAARAPRPEDGAAQVDTKQRGTSNGDASSPATVRRAPQGKTEANGESPHSTSRQHKHTKAATGWTKVKNR